MKNKEDVEQSEALSDNNLSFGKYLREARIEKGMTVEDILDQTRISKYVIEQIENENLDKLPEDVFLKGFLKAYAEMVGLDPEDVVGRYKAVAGIGETNAVSAEMPVGENAGMKKIVIGLLLGLVLLLIITASLWDTDADRGQDTGGDATVNEAVVDSEGNVTPNPVSDTSKAVSKEKLLEIVCVEATTLKISTDGGKPSEYVLKPEDHLELKAKNQYNILIDNTCGVTLFLDDEPVNIPGKCGQTVNIQLP